MYIYIYIYGRLVDCRQTVDSSEHTAHRIEMIMVIDYTTDEDVIRNKIFTILMTLLGLWLYCYTHWLVMPTTWLYLWTIALSWLPPVIVPRFTRPPHFHLKVRPSICVVKPAHLSFNPPICWWNNRKDCFKVPPFHSIHSIHWWPFFLLNSPISSIPFPSHPIWIADFLIIRRGDFKLPPPPELDGFKSIFTGLTEKVGTNKIRIREGTRLNQWRRTGDLTMLAATKTWGFPCQFFRISVELTWILTDFINS